MLTTLQVSQIHILNYLNVSWKNESSKELRIANVNDKKYSTYTYPADPNQKEGDSGAQSKHNKASKWSVLGSM